MADVKLSHSLLKSVLRKEKNSLMLVAVQAAIIGILSLIVPVTVQSLVNSVGLGSVLQPIVVLTAFVFGLLALAGWVRISQFIAAEKLFRRFFVNSTVYMADYLLKTAPLGKRQSKYGLKAHRFFEVVYLQKVCSQLILEGIVLILQTFVGLVLLAFYHPLLLAFDVLLVLGIFIICGPMRKGALKSAYNESTEKYAIAATLQSLSNSDAALTGLKRRKFVFDQLDRKFLSYLDSRGEHFGFLLRQWMAAISIQVVFSAMLLGLGAYLVLNNQLSLGQLVASEIVLTGVLIGVSKIGKLLESYYDLAISFEKLSSSIEIEATGKTPEEIVRPKVVFDKYEDFNKKVRFLEIDGLEGMRGMRSERGKVVSMDASFSEHLITTQDRSIADLKVVFVTEDGERLLARETGYYYYTEFVYFPGAEIIPGVSIRDQILLDSDSTVSEVEILDGLRVLGLYEDYSKESISLDSPVEEMGYAFSKKFANVILYLRALFCDQVFVVLSDDYYSLPRDLRAQFSQAVTSSKYGSKGVLILESGEQEAK